jgi:hypothetical protein
MLRRRRVESAKGLGPVLTGGAHFSGRDYYTGITADLTQIGAVASQRQVVVYEAKPADRVARLGFQE